MREAVEEHRGAALTARPLIGEAWRRCCERQGVAYQATAATVEPIASAAEGHRLFVLADAPVASHDAITRLQRLRVRVVLLAAAVGSPSFRGALDAGVDAVVTVADSVEEAAEALAQLVAGASYISPTAARIVLNDRRRRGAARGDDVRLSAREQQVLRAMVDGLTVKGTARQLGVALKTVEAHRSRIFSRLGVHNQTEAVARALTDTSLLGGPS